MSDVSVAVPVRGLRSTDGYPSSCAAGSKAFYLEKACMTLRVLGTPARASGNKRAIDSVVAGLKDTLSVDLS